MFFKSYLILNKIDLHTDSVMKSLNEITKFKEISNTIQKSSFIYYPVFGAGILLMIWNSIVLNTKTILFLSVLFIGTYVLGIWKGGKDKERFTKLEKDIIELKEYTEE